jgi:peptidoglycan hydrolase-like protein with peptidoglycan-binding domain
MNTSVKIIIGVGILLFLGGIVVLLQGGSEGGVGNPLSNLFPDITINNNENPNTTSTTTPTTNERDLIAVSGTPVAGYVHTTKAGNPIIRYAEKGTGHIYDYDIKTNTSEKISNETLSDVQKVLWAPDGSRFIAQSVAGDILITTAYTLSTSGTFIFTKNLSPNTVNVDVLELQKTLNKYPDTQVSLTGLGSPGNETTRYGEATQKAVARFQEKYASEILTPQNLTKGTGIFDTPTREKLNSILASATDVVQITLSQKRFPLGTMGITISPDGKQVFYLLTQRNGGVNGFVSAFDGTGAKNIYSSNVTELTPYWNDTTNIFLTTKPSSIAEGYLFALNPVTKEVLNPLRKIAGLTTQTSSNKDTILYSRKRAEGGAPELSLYDKKSATSEVLSVRTLPEKCVWLTTTLYCGVPEILPPAAYPDDWYKGLVQFSDSLWLVNEESRQNQVTTLPAGFDIENLSGNEAEKTISFVNRKDGLLWMLRLPN